MTNEELLREIIISCSAISRGATSNVPFIHGEVIVDDRAKSLALIQSFREGIQRETVEKCKALIDSKATEMIQLSKTVKTFGHFNVLVNCNARYVECRDFLDELIKPDTQHLKHHE